MLRNPPSRVSIRGGVVKRFDLNCNNGSGNLVVYCSLLSTRAVCLQELFCSTRTISFPRIPSSLSLSFCPSLTPFSWGGQGGGIRFTVSGCCVGKRSVSASVEDCCGSSALSSALLFSPRLLFFRTEVSVTMSPLALARLLRSCWWQRHHRRPNFGRSLCLSFSLSPSLFILSLPLILSRFPPLFSSKAGQA